MFAFSALTLLVGRQEGHQACKQQWWGAGVVVCLEQGADLHTAQLMPLPLTVCCFSKIQIGFTFLVSAHPGSPGKRAVKRVCVCVCVSACMVVCTCVCAVCSRSGGGRWTVCWHHATGGLRRRQIVSEMIQLRYDTIRDAILTCARRKPT